MKAITNEVLTNYSERLEPAINSSSSQNNQKTTEFENESNYK